ncbi:Cell division protein ZapA, partial [Dysosmobacter welbionis]
RERIALPPPSFQKQGPGQAQALWSQPSTSTILWDTSSLMAARAGFRYSRGSNLSGCSAMNLRMVPVMARRRSESMLILHTALRAALRSCSSGMPTASGILPPNSLTIRTNSWGT